MAQIRIVHDPLGNSILIPHNVSTLDSCLDYSEMKQVISHPGFVIQVEEEELYFFRLIEWGRNILVEAKASENYFIIHSWRRNPTVAYISELLKKGDLISFQYKYC